MTDNQTSIDFAWQQAGAKLDLPPEQQRQQQQNTALQGQQQQDDDDDEEILIGAPAAATTEAEAASAASAVDRRAEHKTSTAEGADAPGAAAAPAEVAPAAAPTTAPQEHHQQQQDSSAQNDDDAGDDDHTSSTAAQEEPQVSMAEQLARRLEHFREQIQMLKGLEKSCRGELHKVNERKSNLAPNMEKLQREEGRLREMLDDLKERLENERAKLAEHEKDLATSTGEKRDALEKLRQKHAQREQEYQDSLAKQSKLDRQAREHEQQVAKLKDDVRRLEDLERQLQRVSELEVEFKANAAKIAVIKAKLEALEEAIRGYKRQLCDLEEENNRLNTEILENKERIRLANGKLTQQQALLDEAKKRREAAVAAAQQKVEEHLKKIAQLEKLRPELEKKQKDAEAAYREKKNKCAEVEAMTGFGKFFRGCSDEVAKNEVTFAKEDLDKAEAALKACNEDAMTAERAELERLSKNVLDVGSSFDTGEIAEIQRQIADTEELIAGYTVENKTKQARIDKIPLEVVSLEGKHEAAESQKQNLELDLETRDAAQIRLSNDITTMREQIEARMQPVENAREDLAAAEEAARKFRNGVDALAESNVSLGRKIAVEKESDLNSARENFDATAWELMRARGELAAQINLTQERIFDTTRQFETQAYQVSRAEQDRERIDIELEEKSQDHESVRTMLDEARTAEQTIERALERAVNPAVPVPVRPVPLPTPNVVPDVILNPVPMPAPHYVPRPA